MPIELSRRSFLIGSAAAIVAASMPFATPVPAAATYRRRNLWEVLIGFDEIPDLAGDTAEIELRRGPGGPCLVAFAMNTRWSFYWVAPYNQPIICFPDKPLDMSVKAARGIGSIQLRCGDIVDDGPEIARFEYHTFPSKGPAQIVDLYPDNSLKARIARNKNPLPYDAYEDVWYEDDD